ncbi:GIY-YIG nuclease family protein [Streptomyces violaceoruber]|uniref:GIY-YIG nuclease family protein n=1 Tax=Streptomyces violaceoruber TaxID=1935 RepID=UPI00403C4233
MERQRAEVRITSRVRLSPQQQSTDPATAEDLGCVYYITYRRNDDFVKIGTTTKASQRFRSFVTATGDRPRLLVAEPGGRTQEHQRHSQFDHLRTPGTELFAYTEELLDHIADLRRRFPNYRDLTDVGMSYD